MLSMTLDYLNHVLHQASKHPDSAMRTKVQSDEGKAIYRKRKTIAESAFGEMKEVQDSVNSISAAKKKPPENLCACLKL